MARKKERIYHMKSGEQEICKALYRTGAMSIEDARKHFDVSDKRFNLMLRDKYIEKVGRYLYLDEEGKKYLENKLGMKYQYRANKTHIKHDLKLNKIYLKLPQKQRDTWKTETQLRHELTTKTPYKKMYNDPKFKTTNNRKNFIPDAVVYSEALGQEIVLEAYTSSYSDMDKLMKFETAARFYNGKIYMF
jgi:hypothetical protein